MFTNLFGSNLAVDIFLKKDGTTEKGCCFKIEDWGFSVHFVLGFQENSIYTYVLYKVLYKTKVLYTKWYKVFTKTDSCFQKSHEEFGQLQTGSGKSKNLRFDGLLLSKKHISSARTFYT